MFELLLLMCYCVVLVLLARWWSRAGLARFPLTASGLTCAGCGYDLGGLPTGAHCPECGGWRRLPEVLAERRVPLWVPAWAAGGSVLANAPGFAILGAGGVFDWALLVAPGVFAGVLLVSSVLIAQRPRKTAAKAALVIPLTIQCLGQVIETVPLYHNPPTGFLSGLGYFFAIAAPTFYASVALALLCLIGIVVAYVRQVTP